MGLGAGLGAVWWLGKGDPLQSCASPELVFSADHERGLDVTAGEAGLEIPFASEQAAAAFRNDPANSLPRTNLGTGHGLGEAQRMSGTCRDFREGWDALGEL